MVFDKEKIDVKKYKQTKIICYFKFCFTLTYHNKPISGFYISISMVLL